MMSKSYSICFHCVDEAGQPYARTKYCAYFVDGTVKKGRTDDKGYTPIFYTEKAENISLHLEVENIGLVLDI